MAAPWHLVRRLLLATLLTGSIWPLGAVSTGAQTNSLTFTPASIVAGDSTTVTGTGFTPGETVRMGGLTYQGGPQTTTANAAGAISFTGATVPLLGSATYTPLATGSSSGIVATGSLKVDAPTMSISLTPTSVQAGGTVSYTAGGFAPGESVKVSGPFGATVTANGSGQISGSIAVASLAPSATYAVFARGNTTTRQANTTLAVTALPAAPGTPAITAAQPTLVIGQSTTLRASGFLPGEQVVFDAPSTRTIVAADGGGAAQAAFTAELSDPPATGYSLTAYGQTSSRIARGTIDLVAATPSVTVSPSSINAGDSVTWTATGFPPNSNICPGGPPSIQDGCHTTDSSGSFSETVVVLPGMSMAI